MAHFYEIIFLHHYMDVTDEAETVKTTVIDETTQSGPHITIIQNQTNIGHSESKTYNLKDCNVTFND
jgi:hypothetical protein